MDFDFSEEQRLIGETVRVFAQAELLPKYAYWDRQGKFPREQWLRMGALGLLGLRVPSVHQGQDFECVTAGLVMEEVARGDFNCGYGLLLSCFAGEMMGRFAEDALCRRWLPPMCRGEAVICVGLTEPHCGSDAAALRTRAVRDGDHYLLTGEKSGITLLMVGDAVIVFASTDPDAGARGISAFLVPLDLPGIARQPYADMGARGIVRGSLFMDAVRIPAHHRLGEEGAALSGGLAAFDYTRALIGLMCLGAAQVTLEETITYLKQRQAFGKPLSMNQGTSFPIAEWTAKIEMARWLCYRTLWLRDAGRPHTAEAAMCKFLCPDLATSAIQDCLILHGHYGYTQDFPVEQRLRDVMGQQIADGTPQIQKLILARHLFGREFV